MRKDNKYPNTTYRISCLFNINSTKETEKLHERIKNVPRKN